MTELVTDAAIDAASEAVFANRGLADDPLIPVLNAAAPFIAAQALRQAASELLAFKSGHVRDHGYDRAIETAITYLGSRADELERDAAFTGMVQLGQEIGDE